MNGRVIVGFASTAAGYQALRYAVLRASENGAPLVAVRAVGIDAYEPWSDAEHRMVTAVSAELSNAFLEALGRVPGGLDVRVAVKPGPLAHVLGVAADQPDDLVVLGACTRRRLVGRVHAARLRRCLRSIFCPTVVVPPPAMARQGSLSRLGREAVAELERLLRQPVGLTG
jgi:nucleotide-binding universal stress UspA family protein